MRTPSLSIKTIFFSLILVYILVISIALLRPTHNNISLTKAPRELSSLRINNTQPENPYRFLNPDLAYKILSQLDVLPTSLARTGYNSKDENPLPYLHLLKDDNYCEKHREYITHFPETIFTEMNVIMDGHPLTLVRNKVVAPIANDVQRHIGQHMPKNDTTLYDIKPQVTLFLTRERLFEEKRIGQHFSCLTQSSSAIPTRYILSKKDGFAEAVAEYAKQYADRPDCFNFQKVVPKTYLLYREQDCRDFFQAFNSPSYQTLKKERRIVYITKDANNKHMGSGVEPVNDKREAELRAIYGNGALCGKVEDRFLVQNYIHNPLLLHGRKFDFRMYLLIASSNPYMAYYHDGFLRVSLLPYDVNSDDKKVLLTNLALSYQIYDDAKGGKFFEGMDEEALKHAQQWSCERLQDYLLETGVISDPNWLDNYLRPKLKKALAHLLRFSIKPMYEHSSVFQLIGMDFMLDEDLNLWYIEANSKPGLGAYSQQMEKFIVKMLQDELEIVTGLLRSRMKRIIRYVNKLMTNDSIQEAGNGEIAIKDVEKEIVAFKKLSKNWFEKEFEPSQSNGWHKILDENYFGVDRYNGLIEERCL